MGFVLNSPLDAKLINYSSNTNISCTTVEMQGFRMEMEDAKIVCLSLYNHPETAVFGVFDGHCNEHVSTWLSKNITEVLDKLKDLSTDKVKDRILKLDQEFIQNYPDIAEGGSTLILAIITKKAQYPYICRVFNIGDSRAFLYTAEKNLDFTNRRCPSFSLQDTELKKFIPLSKDHKPDLSEEEERIKLAGGFVSRDQMGYSSRVDGNLAMSRAFGDKVYKGNKNLEPVKQKVIALADVTEVEIYNGDRLFITCDGLFEFVSWETVFKKIERIFVSLENKYGSEKEREEHIEEYISSQYMLGDNCAKQKFKKALSLYIILKLIKFSLKNNSKDNMTAMLIEFGEGFEIQEDINLFQPTSLEKEINQEVFIKAYLKFAKKSGFNPTDALYQGLYKHISDLSANENEETKLLYEQTFSIIENRLESFSRNYPELLDRTSCYDIISNLKNFKSKPCFNY